MVHRLNVIEKYLEAFSVRVAAKMTLDPADMSNEDTVTQTAAVEKMINNIIRSKLPKWKDKVFAVGGFVRDSLLGKGADDLDLVADDPEHGMESGKELSEQLARVLGIETQNNPHELDSQFRIYGLVLANPKVGGKRERFTTPDGVDVSGYKLEITPPREEGEYDEKRRPKTVKYTSRKEDALRRDLTVNSLFKNITGTNLDNTEENIEDYSGGLEDLKNGVLRKPEHPDRGPLDIYFDDPLRILRLVRFKGKMPDFKIDQGTEEDAKKFMNSPDGRKVFQDKVSLERVKEELVKVLTLPNGKDAREGLERMNEYNVLDFISPTLSKLLDVKHDNIYHKGESGWEHSMDVLEKTPPKLETRLAALLHDIGKTETLEPKKEYYNEDKGEWVEMSRKKPIPEGAKTRDRSSFPKHADIGSQITEKVLKELKFPIKISDVVKNMVHSHMGLKHSKPGTGNFLYRARVIIHKLYENVDDIIDLMRADLNVEHGSKERQRFESLFSEIKRIKDEDTKNGLLVVPGSSNKPSYKTPLDLNFNDIKAFTDEKSKKGKAFEALKELARIRSMSGAFDKDKYFKEIEELQNEEALLEKLIAEHQKFKKSDSFYSKFERTDKKFQRSRK